MGTHADQAVEAIAAAIVAHLRTHPHAADSASGVASWWLGCSAVAVAPQQVESALERLVLDGTMERLQLMDGTFLYSEARVGKTPPARSEP